MGTRTIRVTRDDNGFRIATLIHAPDGLNPREFYFRELDTLELLAIEELDVSDAMQGFAMIMTSLCQPNGDRMFPGGLEDMRQWMGNRPAALMRDVIKVGSDAVNAQESFTSPEA